MNTAAATTVRVQSDTSTLLQALRATFTDHTKVLGELLQNGRRAKATRLEITVTDEAIAISDDGVGIDDPSVLLAIAKSGWDEETMKDDAPYGLGWVSCLFACETVSVMSKGKHLIAQTEDLIALKPVVVNESADLGFTEVRLLSHRLGKASTIIDHLRSLARGFPIPVIVNGTELERPYALTSGEWVEGEVCLVHRSAALNLSNVGNTVGYYLQGLPIGIFGSRSSWHDSAIHLKSPQVKGRLPERDTVLEPNAVHAAVQKDRRDIAGRVAREMAAAGEFDTLLKASDTLAELELLDLIDGANRVPDGVLEVFKEAPYLTREWNSDEYLGDAESMTLDDLRALGAIYWTPGGLDDETLVDKHFVNARKGVMVGNAKYVSWLSKFVEVHEVDATDITVEPINVRGSGSMAELWQVEDVQFVDGIRLVHPTLGAAELAPKSAVFAKNEDGNTLYVTEGANASDAVCQVEIFVDEDDRDDDDWRTRASNELYLQMMDVFGSASPVALFQQVINDAYLSLPERVKGQTFTVTVDAMGLVTVA